MYPNYKISTIVAGMLLVQALYLPAQDYDPGAQFSPTNNPNGVWSYGWSPSVGGSLTLYSYHTNSGIDFNNIDMWQGRLASPPGYTPMVFHNGTSAPQLLGASTVNSGQFGLHPGPQNQVSVVRWTAPRSGSLSFAAGYFPIHPDANTDVYVLKNGATLSAGTVHSGAGPSFSATLLVVGGDTIDFAVGSNGDYVNDATGLTATLNFTPEGILRIRVSHVELCWETRPDRYYQLEYRSTLTTNTWTALGSVTLGSGSRFCTNDMVLPDEPKRFYQVIVTDSP